MPRILLVLTIFTASAWAQQPQISLPRPPLGDGPFVFDTAEQHKIRVVGGRQGLAHPWSLAFLPGR